MSRQLRVLGPHSHRFGSGGHDGRILGRLSGERAVPARGAGPGSPPPGGGRGNRHRGARLRLPPSNVPAPGTSVPVATAPRTPPPAPAAAPVVAAAQQSVSFPSSTDYDGELPRPFWDHWTNRTRSPRRSMDQGLMTWMTTSSRTCSELGRADETLMFALLTLTLLMSTRLGAQDSTAASPRAPELRRRIEERLAVQSRNSSDSPTSR